MLMSGGGVLARGVHRLAAASGNGKSKCFGEARSAHQRLASRAPRSLRVPPAPAGPLKRAFHVAASSGQGCVPAPCVIHLPFFCEVSR